MSMEEETNEGRGLLDKSQGVTSSNPGAGRDTEMDKEEGEGVDEEGEEEEEGGEEEEDEEGDGEEEEYMLQFEGEMDPLDFVEEDAFGLEPYQQFEWLEYEALAEKKRKALQKEGGKEPAKKRQDDVFGANFEEIMESMTRRSRRKSGKPKKRGRRKGSKNKLNPVITRKLGDATLHYASGSYDEAIHLLEEVVQLAPNLPDAYHTLGLIYNAIGDRKKALNFYMLAAHMMPKDPSIWKLLVTWSIEQGNTGQARYCLSKAVTADPKDMDLRFDRALLYIQLGDYLKAAESYDQIFGMYPANVEARILASKMYQKCGQIEKAISILDNYNSNHSTEGFDLGVVNLLAALHMENNAHSKALQQIEHAHSTHCSGKELPLYLTIKAGICQAYLGNMETAQSLFGSLQKENAQGNSDLVLEVADAFSVLGCHDSALNYYLMLEGTTDHDNGPLHVKVANCYSSLNEREKAISFFYKAVSSMEDNVDVRITLSSLLLEEGKMEAAINLLSAPKSSESAHPRTDRDCATSKPWWLNGRVKMQLAKIYHGKGMLEEFVDAIFLSVRETLLMESMNEKVRPKKRLNTRDLLKRVKLLDDQRADNLFCGHKPIATRSDLVKAFRARKLLKKKAASDEKKSATLASGLDCQTEESEDEYLKKKLREPPLPRLLKDEEHYRLILNLCKALSSLRRYWEALEIINHALRLASNMSTEKKEELRSLGAQIAYNTTHPTHGYEYVRYIVQQHPHSSAAWNCYYKVISRFESQYSKHEKFLNRVRDTYPDCVPPMVINGHRFTMNPMHQSAAREYLQAYKLQPDNPLINLCVGTSLINLAHNSRLRNKHHCVAQGFAFLYNYLRICHNSQEALYNIARAYQHVGLATLAVSYYEQVLTIKEEDYPMPKLPNEESTPPEIQNTGYCDLRREAAYNLHLIYKRSGAVDLARQVLKNYCRT